MAADAPPGGTFLLGGDLPVARLGFGAMRICGAGVWGPPSDPAAARRLLQRAVELGVTLIDTADAYGPEVSERLIAAALHPYPPGLVIATKGGLTRPRRESWIRDGRPVHLRAACEASLKRLRRECIDLYQLHAPDPVVPFEDQVGALAELRAAGKIRHIGLSNVNAGELAAARRIVPIAAVQNRNNFVDRTAEPVLAECEKAGLAFLPWYPLEAGGSVRDGGTLARVAQRHATSAATVALAWLLVRSPVMLPIPGTSKVAHLEENVAAAEIELSDDDFATLSKAGAGGD